MRLSSPLLLLLLAAAASAQPTPGNCALGSAEGDLSISDVRARLFDTGSLFFSGSAEAEYIVPKATGTSAIYAAGLWIGGEVDGELRGAGARYANFEFWPGPLDPGATLPEPDCRRLNANGREAWDRVYTVSVFDVEVYEDDGTTTPDLEDWPVGLGAPTVDAMGNPVVPTSRDQLIDLAAGERPVIYGGQTAFWVMNDVGNDHDEWETPPVGLEVRVSAFAIPAPDDPAFNRGTLYRYEVVNRYTEAFEDAYLSFFADVDLGDGSDDLAGSDSLRSLAYVYNANNTDGGPGGYGTPPPAIGVDLLTGASSGMYFISGGPPGTSDPIVGTEYYNIMQGRWTNGLPLVECGIGINCAGDVTTWAFNGDPVAGSGWTEISAGNNGGDRRIVITSEPFTLQPGESRVFDAAIVFALGDNRFDSIAEMFEASDAVQAAYDDGSLFETIDTDTLPDPPGEAPALLAPPDGADLSGEDEVLLTWEPVDRADFYEVQIAADADFSDPDIVTSPGPSVTLTEADLEANREDPFYWRVRGANTIGEGPFSEARSFTYFYYRAAWAGDGDGIVERAYPGVPDVCAGAPADPGCQRYNGNTVWHDENANGDYYLSAGGGDGSIGRLSRYIEAAVPDEFEVRFTEVGGLAVYGFGDNEIASVPFELWNIGPEEAGANDPADDVRLIPFLNPNEDPLTDWEDAFTAPDPWEGSPCSGGCPITDWVYFMQPDRPDGYDLFEAAAIGFGGAGAVYVPSADGDTQVDPDPLGGTCQNQGYYVDFCYRNQEFANNGGPSSFIYPVGRLVFADLANDGTTPPTGTLVRLTSVGAPPVATEPDGGALPEAYALEAVRPNPFRGRTVVGYAVPETGHVRLAVYDLLGREVAVLADELRPAGRHEAALDGRGLASGTYVVVLVGEGGARATRKLTLLR